MFNNILLYFNFYCVSYYLRLHCLKMSKRVLYAVNGTGQGHISRAKSLIPYLKQHVSVDILVSGKHQDLNFSHPITYDFRGFTFIFKKGGVAWLDTLKQTRIIQFIKDVRSLDLSSYDLIITDFEPVSAWAAFFQKKKCLNVSHQASFYSMKTPRPFTWFLYFPAELFLRYFSLSNHYIGVHFKPYTSRIFPPIIKDEIITATPETKGHITVYLAAYSFENQVALFKRFPDTQFEIFHSGCKREEKIANLKVSPLSESFKYSLITSSGYISNAGFESNAEALYLQKPLMCIPQIGQYEQYCNGAALKKLGVYVPSRLTYRHVKKWLSMKKVLPKLAIGSTEELVKEIIDHVH